MIVPTAGESAVIRWLCKPLPLAARSRQWRKIHGFVSSVTVLRRASISGRVEVGGELADYFADVHDGDGNLLETVALDRDSYRALKYRWMRCKVQR